MGMWVFLGPGRKNEAFIVGALGRKNEAFIVGALGAATKH
jgi:hypothetical protein